MAAKKKEYRADPERRAEYRELDRQAHLKKYAKPGHRESINAWHREYHLKNKYGLTPGAVTALRVHQLGRCDICGDDLQDGGGMRGTHIDHCHETGRVRALLCGHCNTALGHMKDDPARLRAAADYLEKHNAVANGEPQ